MNLVIHDLKPKEWSAVSRDYKGWQVISDRWTIRPCVGCFCCWNKTSGQCIVKDGYENMGALIHHAGEVHVISRYCFGGFSPFVKNVFDRSLGYVLPQFEVIDGETHHQKRYDEDKPFTFIFYGHELSAEEKASAARYVKAVCANIRGHVKALLFWDWEEAPAVPAKETEETGGKIILLNGSMRSRKGNSAKLSRQLGWMLKSETKTVELKAYMNRLPELLSILEGASAIVLCTPLYVDGLPSQMIRLLDTALREYRGGSKKIYVLANMGLYESSQLVNLFGAVRQWCARQNMAYCGGLGVSGGELVGVLMQFLPFGFGPTKKIAAGMKKLAKAIDSGGELGDIFADPVRFPRSLFIKIANESWNCTARKNGLKPGALYRRL